MAIASLPGRGPGRSPRSTYTVTLARRQFAGESLEAVIAAFEHWRDETGVGASDIGSRYPVHRNGVAIGELSYNGRWWPTAALEVPAVISSAVPVLTLTAALAHAGLAGRYDADRGALIIEPATAQHDAARGDEDARAGMAWFNSLSRAERAHWLEVADSAVPADAWRAFQNSIV